VGELPAFDELLAGLAVIEAEEVALGGEDVSGGTGEGDKEFGVLLRLNGGHGETTDVMHDSGGVGVVLVEGKCESELFCDERGGEVVVPDELHGGQGKRFADVGADGDGEADALNIFCAETRDGLKDVDGGIARGKERRVGDGEELAVKGRVGGDDLRELEHGDIVFADHLHDAQGDLWKWAEAEEAPRKIF